LNNCKRFSWLFSGFHSYKQRTVCTTCN